MAFGVNRQSPTLPQELTVNYWTVLDPPGRTILNENHQIIIKHLKSIQKYHTIITYDIDNNRIDRAISILTSCIDSHNKSLTHVARSLMSILKQLLYTRNKALLIRAIPYIHRTDYWTPQKYLDHLAKANMAATKHLSAIKLFADSTINDCRKIMPGNEFYFGEFFAIKWTSTPHSPGPNAPISRRRG